MATLTTTHNFNFNENICKSVFKTEFDKEKDLTKIILKYVDNTIANNSMFFKQRYGNNSDTSVEKIEIDGIEKDLVKINITYKVYVINEN